MRIAVVVRSLKIGGMERAAINLAEAFEANGHEAHLIYFRDKGKVLEPNKNVHLHYFNLDKIMKLTIIGFFWNIIAKLISIIVRESFVYLKAFFVTPIFKYKIRALEKKYGRFDLIILRGQGTFETIWNMKDKRLILQQVSVVFTKGNRLKDFYFFCLYKNKNILCNSVGVKEELLKVMNNKNIYPARIDVITNLINLEEVQAKSLLFSPDINFKYIINVGRLVPGKNILLLLEAFAYAKETLSLTHKLVLVGDGDIRDKVESKIISLNIQNDVILTGSLSNPYPWVKNADLFVFTSAAEGLPNVLLEALACGTNVISTDGKGGIKDIMKGELSKNLTSFDKVEIAEKIVTELKNNKSKNFNKYLAEFTPKYIIEKYIKTYL